MDHECCHMSLYPDNGFNFEDIDKVLTCETCGLEWVVNYDESFDEESDEEDCWFWIEMLSKS
jgi:hypothetical protein